MLPLNRLLVSTDFSEASYGAFGPAGELAELFRARVILVHVIAPVPLFAYDIPALDPGIFTENLRELADKRLNELIPERFPAGLSIETRIIFGDPARTIVQTARESRVDMVVISTHGQTGLKHTLFGSVAERVVRLADCPVLVIQASNPRVTE